MSKLGGVGCLLGAVLLISGCTSQRASVPPAATASQAVRAFEAMYPGFKGGSAESTVSAWLVSGTLTPAGNEDSDWPPIRFRVPLRVGGSGVATTSIDGVVWSGSADLAAVTETRPVEEGEGDVLSYSLADYTDVPGFVVTDVRREPSDSVLVSVETSDQVLPPLSFEWDRDGWWADDDDWWTHVIDAPEGDSPRGDASWPKKIGGVSVAGDREVTRGLGRGLYDSEEGHGGGRYYTNANHSLTLHVVIGVDRTLDTVEITDGIALPNGLHLGDDPGFVSAALGANPAIDGKIRLGASVAEVVKRYGKPDTNHKTGVQRILTYDLSPTPDEDAGAWFTFVRGKLRSATFESYE